MINYIRDNISNKTNESFIDMDDISLMSESISLMENTDMELRYYLLSLHDSNVVTEASARFDSFVGILKKIINFFKKTIIDIFSRAYTFILELFGNPKDYIAKYKDQLHNMKGFDISKYTSIKYYDYTYFDTDTPDPNLYLKFIENYEYSLKDLKSIANSVSKQELIASINKLEDSTETTINSDFFNNLRGEIIHSVNKNAPAVISAELYQEQLFSLFRGGASTFHKGEMKISSDQVAISCDRYLSYKDLSKKLKKEKDTIVNSADDITKKFSNIGVADFIKEYKTDTEVNYALSRYIKKKIAQLSEMCNIFVMAYSAKIDAVKECAIMDKKICYKAITHLLSGDLED